MNLPIGKLFYFVPQIQGYTASTVNPLGTAGQQQDHRAPVGSPGNYPGDPNAGYNDAQAYPKNLYDLFYEGTEPGLNPAGLFDYSKGAWAEDGAKANAAVIKAIEAAANKFRARVGK